MHRFLLAVLVCALVVPLDAIAGPVSRPAVVTVVDATSSIDANGVSMVLSNLGAFAYDLSGASAWGLHYPGSSGNGVVYASGLWVSASVAGGTRLAVAEYSQEFRPGRVAGGVPESPDDPQLHVFKLHRTYATVAERTSALDDYDNGAVVRGAPVVSVQPDGSLDIPGAQMCWAVYNDLVPSAHTNRAASTAPLGVEVQQTTWAYAVGGPLANAVFLKFKITNRSANTLGDTYVAFWADPDLGQFNDDLIGSDSTLSLGYCYNGTNNDAVYGAAPPAVGYCLLQGPAAGAGARLPLTSLTSYVNGTDPSSAGESNESMHGRDFAGNPILDPDGNPTRFMFAGDPVAGTGWLDLHGTDKRMLLSSGPFTMAPGAVQEVVLAVVVSQGADRVDSVQRLKQDVARIRSAFAANQLELLDVPRVPGSPLAIDRTSPNPARGDGFSVSFTLADRGAATVEVLDVAGRSVLTRPLGDPGAGRHTVSVPAGRALEPGIYFIRLSQRGQTVQARTVLLR